MKIRSYRYDINRPAPGHNHKYSKYKRSPSITVAICIEKHLSNNWSSIEKVSNTEAEKKKRKPCIGK